MNLLTVSNLKFVAFLYLLLIPGLEFAQQPCATGIRIEGSVTDSTGAAIPGARVQAGASEGVVTDASGLFALPCVVGDTNTLTVQAEGFSPGTAKADGVPGKTTHIDIHLQMAQVETSVQVTADPTAIDADSGSGTRTLTADDINQLPDDPDDLLQQLQILASSGGGSSSSATIVVDGFQNGSALPPKNSIASIRVNPDAFSPEYERASSQGGRIEIITKPGADSFHGALFLTDSDGSFNATNPFSVTATPAGKRRYGFELSGPILRSKSGFSLALEKRDIDEFNVINASTLNSSGNQVPLQQTVTAPQRLWIASSRGDWQLSPKDVATLSFSANVNNLGNQGIGGLTLAEAGYSSLISEYDLRFSNVLTLNANLLHETRIGYSWKRTQQTPLSAAPSVQVAGFFTGGGATSQNLNSRERDLEVDDDVMITRGKHSMKFGAQSLIFFVHNYDPDTFNGSYVFGGGSAPTLDANNNPTGQTTTISGLEQYRRALFNLPGGTPTTYQLTSGTPLVPFTQGRLALFAEDTIKLTHNLTISTGLRYALQSSPSSFANLSPRFGLAWSPDKKATWVIHLRGGLFSGPVKLSYPTQVARLNGSRQQQTLVYSPSFTNPLTPVPGSIQVGTTWQFPRTFTQGPSAQVQVGVDHELPHHWQPEVWFTWGDSWGDSRAVNINAPLVNASVGAAPDPIAALLAPRPFASNQNILQYQTAGHTRGSVIWVGVSQKGYKRLTLNMGYWGVNFKSDVGADTIQPQSSYSKRGEVARPDWQSSGALVESDLKLPAKIEISAEFYMHTGLPFNITTGTDANGDGSFNDRPAFASAPGAGVYKTSYGLLSTNAVNGDVPRNLGTMPSVFHTYANVSRVFKLNRKNGDHPPTLTFNVRSSNVLNHTNPTAVGTVVSSSNFGQAISAETARRLELGVRFAF